MARLDDANIPYSKLSFDTDVGATLTAPAAGLEPEVVGALLTRVVRHVATSSADGQVVEPVTVNVNVTGRAEADEIVRFAATIDRRTRTLVFISGEACAADRIILAVTGVYRIISR